MSRMAVVGAGSWGTVLAGLLADNGHDVVLWSFETDVVDQVMGERENRKYLPDVRLPDSLRATTDIGEAVRSAEMVLSVSPSQFVASVMGEAAAHIREDATVVSASKGIEATTLRRMDEVLLDTLGPARMERFCVLSGPSFAREVARKSPTAVVVASTREEAASRVQGFFQNANFRVYTNADVLGVELGGALKNVIALGAGVAAGLGFGHNTMAALLTRGLAEITRLGLAMGAQRATFMGLAGMGDLVLTCTGELSRNRTVGYRLGQGEALSDILDGMDAVAEGIRTAQAVRDLAERHGVEMPICREVVAMLVEERSPRVALENLMKREPKPEDWS